MPSRPKPMDPESALVRTDGESGPRESVTQAAEDSTQQPPAGVLGRGSTIGRYVVLEQIGAGGMGVVYSAYDPELDRKIAIKVLQPRRPAGGSNGKARLLREAQALARLSHPNIVNVHDVGEFPGGVFVAMEYIEGLTLRQWLAKEERGQARILSMFIAAGQGLAAAHAAGLVHRDFKPDNVLVGASGRPRVVDFGLARGHSPEEGGGSESGMATTGGSALANALTQAGAVLGTPAYMAPEQHVGGKMDAATDQFSFCVALYKALYGQRPFAGGSVGALAGNVCRGNIRATPPGASVPGWLRRLLVRGLAPLPEDRHPSMAALLGELGKDLSARRRRVGWVLGGSVVVASIGVGAYWTGTHKPVVQCDAAADPIAATWTQARRDAIAGAFEATTLAYAGDTLERVSTELDAYAERWGEQAQEACRATHVAHSQSMALLDRRMGCLGARREALDAVLVIFEKADAEVVERAMPIVEGVPSVEACADLQALGRGVEPPATEALRAAVTELEGALERTAAIYRAGRYREVLLERQAHVQTARTLGYAPLLARATHELSIVQGRLGMSERMDTTRKAFALALRAGDEVMAGGIAMDLANRYGLGDRNSKESAHWVDIGLALAERGGGDLTIEVGALNVQAVTAMRESRFDEAQLSFEAMLARLRDDDPQGPNVSVALMNLGSFHAERRELDAARAYMNEAMELVSRTHGPQHPEMLRLKAKLATLSSMNGDFVRARTEFAEVVQLQRKVFGTTHAELARSMSGQAVAERYTGHLEVAETLNREALRQRIALHGPDHPEIAESLRHLAMVRADRGMPDEALALARKALAMDTRVLPEGHRVRGIDLSEVARHLREQGKYAEAMQLGEQARVILAKEASDRRPLIKVLVGIGLCLRGMERHEDALVPLEQAQTLSELESAVDATAWPAIELALTLRVLGREPSRAQGLAHLARERVGDETTVNREVYRSVLAFFGEGDNGGIPTP